jgi:nucleotide-binding universal stress UspA family protein
MVALAPRKRRFGTLVTTLAHASGVPVVVLRPATSQHAIVAATNLEEVDYPVLRKAIELGEQLHERVIPVHNVTPLSVVVSPDSMLPPITVWPGRGETEVRRVRLAHAVDQLHIAARGLVANDVNPAEAILRVARVEDADVVIVGAHPRSWFGRLVSGSVAAQVVNRARRSVLVVPLEGAGSSLAAPLARA